MASWCVIMLKIALTWSWSISIYWYLKSTNNDRHILHAWLDKDFRSPGMNIVVCKHFNMIHIGRLRRSVEIILKWLQTAILTIIIFNLLSPADFVGDVEIILICLWVTRLIIIYLFIFAVNDYCFNLVNLFENVQNSIIASAKSHQCPASVAMSHSAP